MILVLLIILFLLLAIFNKERGVKAFVSLFINFILIIIAIVLICWGVDPVILAFLFSLGTSAFILFYINGFNIKTKVSYISVVLVFIVVSALIVLIGFNSNISGFDALYRDNVFFVCPIDININYTHVAVAVVIMSLTGAITDIALDITTSLNEVYENNKHLSFTELIKSGHRIGSDVLGTMINTLFFVFIGEIMSFIILYSSQGLATIVNHKLFLQGLSKLLIGDLGCVLIIPITVFIQSYIYIKHRKSS
ncbi:MAG: YibE/F family protein [Oscillospiraceae bacterium]|nr:YibE/F family protein [Oscillospiraceae bacterium]